MGKIGDVGTLLLSNDSFMSFQIKGLKTSLVLTIPLHPKNPMIFHVDASVGERFSFMGSPNEAIERFDEWFEFLIERI
jgi:hypothetical protein